MVKPDKGYVFYVSDLSGQEKEIRKLVYLVEEDTWYYNKVNSGSESDIDTFRLEEK